MVVQLLNQLDVLTVNAQQTLPTVRRLSLALILTRALMDHSFLHQEQPAQPLTGVLLQLLTVAQVEIAQQRVAFLVVVPQQLSAILTSFYVLREVVNQVQLLALRLPPVRRANNSVQTLNVRKLAFLSKEFALQLRPL